jgi:putative membrane protein
MMTDEHLHPASGSETSTELAARRTGMSFQRTRLSADRTLMSVIRTSLSLISFGFTIYSFFQKVRPAEPGTHGARNFGATLVCLGVGMLILGIVYHVQFMRGLRGLREALKAEGLVHAESGFPTSMTLLTALVLLLIGVAAAVSIVFHTGPFD